MAVRITLQAPGGKSLAVDLKDGVYRIGREKPADVVIPDATVSGNHAELQIRGNDWMIRDLGSTNGTFVNETQIRAVTKVKASDSVRLGSVALTLAPPPIAGQAVQTVKTPGAGAEKIRAARQAARKMQWNLRYFIAGLEAILFLLVLFSFVQLYSANSAAKQWLINRYRLFASQYIHVLNAPVSQVPPPILDESLVDAMVADRDGRILFPAEGVKVNPLIDPKTKSIHANAKIGFITLPGTANDKDVSLRSYPVRAGGELVGFVMARPGTTEASPVKFVLMLFLLAAGVSLILLFFALKPVNALVRSQLESLRLKISPFASGFVDALPESDTFEEVNVLAEEIEGAIRTAKTQGTARPGAAGGRGGELQPLLADLFAKSNIPHAFVDQDFKMVSSSGTLQRIAELTRASSGQSIFDAGMTSVQSKQLIQIIGDARRDGAATATMALTVDGATTSVEVTVRQLQHPSTGGQLFGIIFNPRAE